MRRTTTPIDRSFIVTIAYREPTCARHNLRKLHPYRGTYRCFASDESEARTMALDEFRRTAELSSVGWVREVVAVKVTPEGSA